MHWLIYHLQPVLVAQSIVSEIGYLTSLDYNRGVVSLSPTYHIQPHTFIEIIESSRAAVSY